VKKKKKPAQMLPEVGDILFPPPSSSLSYIDDVLTIIRTSASDSA